MTRRMPSRQNTSVSALARQETKGSMSCVNVSRPVEAVTAAGTSSVRSGSISAALATSSGLRRLAFTPVFGRAEHCVSRHFRARAGRGGNRQEGQGSVFERAALPDHFQIIERLSRIGRERRDGFRRIQGAAPAEADHELALARGLNSFSHHCKCRLA